MRVGQTSPRAESMNSQTLGLATFSFLYLACSSGHATSVDSGTGQPQPDSAAADEGGGDGAAMTLTHDIQPIFDSACTRCHATRSPFLTKASSRESLGGMSACTSGGKPIAYVVPGQPEQSFLFYKLGGETALQPVGVDCGGEMPAGGPSLAVTKPDGVEGGRPWVLAGAG